LIVTPVEKVTVMLWIHSLDAGAPITLVLRQNFFNLLIPGVGCYVCV